MSKLKFPCAVVVLGMCCALTLAAAHANAEPGVLTLNLQTRDATGTVQVTPEKVQLDKVGVVVVDMWNYHWCKTSTMRVAAMVPRMNRSLEALRDMGAQVFLCPSDVADNYVGWPMKEAVDAVPRHAVPKIKELTCPAAPDGGGCTCSGPRCTDNWGWDAMHPDLVIGPGDLMPNDQQALYSICKEKGITHLVYMGVHTQVCLLGKSIGLLNMTNAGLQCILCRDLTDAHGHYLPEQGITPDDFTAKVVRHFEQYLSPTVNMVDELRKAGRWDEQRVVDPVRFAPWGTPGRPHIFEDQVTVTLTAPWQPQATIRYTLDGSQPTPESTRYEKPITISETKHFRAAAFQDGKPVCLESEALLARLPATPPAPDVHVSDVKPLRAVGPGHSPASTQHRFSGDAQPPQKDRNNRGEPLHLRGKQYTKGMGVHAPCNCCTKCSRSGTASWRWWAWTSGACAPTTAATWRCIPAWCSRYLSTAVWREKAP